MHNRTMCAIRRLSRRSRRHGDNLRVTDFAPRFERFEWAFRPPQIMRIEPRAGLPRINAFGLLSEDIHPDTGELWGNLPHFLLFGRHHRIATRLSSSWEDAWPDVSS
jgi:hypothetical protein